MEIIIYVIAIVAAVAWLAGREFLKDLSDEIGRMCEPGDLTEIDGADHIERIHQFDALMGARR